MIAQLRLDPEFPLGHSTLPFFEGFVGGFLRPAAVKLCFYCETTLSPNISEDSALVLRSRAVGTRAFLEKVAGAKDQARGSQ